MANNKRVTRHPRSSIELAQKRYNILNLKAAGHTFEEIAEQLSLSTSEVHRCFRKEIEGAIKCTAAELAEIENRKIDYVYKKLKEALDAGDLSVANAMLKASERKSKLNGLDMEKVEVDVKVSVETLMRDAFGSVEIVRSTPELPDGSDDEDS